LSDNLKKQVNDLKEFTLPYYNLKDLQRTGWLEKLNIENSESVASHTLLMIVILLFLTSKYSISSSRKLRLILMILVHDLAESIIGDITPEAINPSKKRKIEEDAFSTILSKFPQNNLRKDLSDVWKEYNEHRSVDSKIIHIIDKMEMLLQADFYLENRKNIEFSQIAPFKESVSSFIEKYQYNVESRLKPNLVSNENRELAEIKEILAYLCK
jgi:putative hydrolase of HD superfamily